MFKFVPYHANDQNAWDDFVHKSKNATFLFRRAYMEYHADRFQEASYMIYKNEKLCALLPGNVVGDKYYSHQGLTYGGFLCDEKMKGADYLELFEHFRALLIAQHIREWIYKPIPYIYAKMPAQEDLYALYCMQAQKVACQLSSAVAYPRQLPWASSRKYPLSIAKKEGLTIVESTHFGAFWELLTDNLAQRHHTQPTHSCDEIERLQTLFPQQIRLFEVRSSSQNLLGACVIFESHQVAHVQYIGANEEGKAKGALDLLFTELIAHTYAHKAFFDFGHSCEEQGLVLNKGLLFQKEGFGARGVVYETYSIPCDN